MKDVEFSLKNFRVKKLLALATCAVLAMGVMVIPVEATTGTQTGDPVVTPPVPGQKITVDGDDPQNIIDAINAGYVNVRIGTKGVESIPSSVFQAAIGKTVALEVLIELENGKAATLVFGNGITKAVDLKLGLSISTEGGILADLKQENAIAIDFEHSGELPGIMTVFVLDESYDMEVNNDKAPVYLLNEENGALEKQEVTASIRNGFIDFAISHCSTYVVAGTEIPENKLQVVKSNVTEEETKTESNVAGKDAIKKTGVTSGNKTLALLAIGGAVIFFATRKEEKN